MKNLFLVSALFALNVNAFGQFNLNENKDNRNMSQQSRQSNNNINVSRNINTTRNLNNSNIQVVNGSNLIQNFVNIPTNKNNLNIRSNTGRSSNPAQRAIPQTSNRNPVSTISNNRGNISLNNTVQSRNITVVRNDEQRAQTGNIQNINTNRNSNPVRSINNSSVDLRNTVVNENNINRGNLNNENANMNESELQISNIDINLEIPPIQIQSQLKINPIVPKLALTLPAVSMGNNKVKTEKVKEEKIKTEKPEALTSKVEKRKGGSSYYQAKNKKYAGKKIKIWFRKNFKKSGKIRFSVSCPNF